LIFCNEKFKFQVIFGGSLDLISGKLGNEDEFPSAFLHNQVLRVIHVWPPSSPSALLVFEETQKITSIGIFDSLIPFAEDLISLN